MVGTERTVWVPTQLCLFQDVWPWRSYLEAPLPGLIVCKVVMYHMKSNSQSCTIKKKKQRECRPERCCLHAAAIMTVITVPLLMFIFCLLATSSSRHFLVPRGASDLPNCFVAFSLLPRPRELLVSCFKTTSPFSSKSPHHCTFPLKINFFFPQIHPILFSSVRLDAQVHFLLLAFVLGYKTK